MTRTLVLLLRWLGCLILLIISPPKLIGGIEMSPRGGKFSKPLAKGRQKTIEEWKMY